MYGLNQKLRSSKGFDLFFMSKNVCVAVQESDCFTSEFILRSQLNTPSSSNGRLLFILLGVFDGTFQKVVKKLGMFKILAASMLSHGWDDTQRRE